MTHTLRVLPLAIAIILLPILTPLLAQVPTIQDCLGAIPICQPIYTEDKVANGFGNYTDEINRDISCLAHEENAIWYTFTVNETGDFGFVLTPNSLQDDYDWALYDLTNASCEEIRTNPDLLVSCNAAGQQVDDMTCVGVTGATGGSGYDTQGGGCHHNPPTLRRGNNPLNALVPVQKGNVYVLVVSNWSRSTNGYTIDFGVSAGIGIFDLEDPEVTNATFPEQCGDNGISIEFNENIQCATVDKFNFVLDGPGGPYDVRLLSPVCDLGGLYTRSFDLLIEPAITTSGTFTLSLDGDRSTEVLDLCNNPAFNTALTFDIMVEEEIEVELGDDITTCPENIVELDATVASPTATYLWNTGATSPLISVAAEGVYEVTVTDECRMGTDLVTFMYNNENTLIVDLGADQVLCEGSSLELDATNFGASYQWNTGSTSPVITVTEAGTYAVTVTDECGTVEDAIEISFTDAPEIDLGADRTLCPNETLELNTGLSNATFVWQDGSTTPNFTVTEAGIYSVAVTTDCGVITDEIQIDYEAELSLELGTDQTICEGTSVLLDVSQENATYVWQDGSTDSQFEVMEAGQYAVTVSNACNSLSDEITIELMPSIDVDLGADQSLCEGDQFNLTVNLDNANFQWQDGSTNHSFMVSEAGIYWLSASNDCFTAIDSVEVTYTNSPQVELGESQQLCEGDTISLDATFSEATYQWQDGSTNPTYSVTENGRYAVEVSNSCGIATDSVIINVINDFELNLGTDFALCEGESTDLFLELEGIDFQWQDGSKEAIYTISQAGTYWVNAANACFQHEDSISVEMNDLPKVDLGVDQTLCPNDTITLTLDLENVNYEWQDGSTNPNYQITAAGYYTLSITNDCGMAMDGMVVNQVEPLEIELGRDTIICEGNSLTLIPQSNANRFQWQDGSEQTSFEVTAAGYYFVEVSNECEIVMDDIEISWCERCEVYIPNVFSPNNDDKNDVFRAFPNCDFLDYSLKIFDRWGTLLFETQELNQGWNGWIQNSTAPNGVYVWQIAYEVEEDGKKRAVAEVGEVTLLR